MTPAFDPAPTLPMTVSTCSADASPGAMALNTETGRSVAAICAMIGDRQIFVAAMLAADAPRHDGSAPAGQTVTAALVSVQPRTAILPSGHDGVSTSGYRDPLGTARASAKSG